MNEILTNDLNALDTDGKPLGPIRRQMTAEEEAALERTRAQGALEEQAEAAEQLRRTQRGQLRASFGDLIPPTWTQVAKGITEARAHIDRPPAQWSQALLVDAAKLSLRMLLFLVARELRRVSDGREAD